MQGPDRSFDALAAEYCALIESCPATSADDLLASLHRLLPALLAAATELPVTEPTNSEALGSRSLPADEAVARTDNASAAACSPGTMRTRPEDAGVCLGSAS